MLRTRTVLNCIVLYHTACLPGWSRRWESLAFVMLRVAPCHPGSLVPSSERHYQVLKGLSSSASHLYSGVCGCLSPHCLPLQCRVLSVLLGVYLFTVCLFCVLVWRSVWKGILNPVTRVLKNHYWYLWLLICLQYCDTCQVEGVCVSISCMCV